MYSLIEIKEELANEYEYKDIARLSLAESKGLDSIVLQIVSEKTGLPKHWLSDVMVSNGIQLCFSPDLDMLHRTTSPKWLDTYWSISTNGVIVCWFNPDGENKYYFVKEV